MTPRRRVVITGLGVVAPNGIGKDAFWTNLLAGKSGVDRITAFDSSKYSSRVAAEVREFDPSDFMASRLARSTGRFTHLAVAAARLALADASVPEGDTRWVPQMAICFGSAASGAVDIGERTHRSFLAEAPKELNPLAMLELSAHAATAHVSQLLGTSGPIVTIASACCTGLDVIAWGCQQILSGQSELALVGATEAPLSEFIFALFDAGGFLSQWTGYPPAASRPFDLLRNGLVLGEAAGAVVLEELHHALDRAVLPYAEIRGFATRSEAGFAGSRRDVYRQGLELTLRSALDNASVPSTTIDYINAHGNSTTNDDAADTMAYKQVFRERAYSIPISSIKSSIGQPLAASGVLQTASTALALRHQAVPATLHRDYPDPDCDLDYVPHEARPARLHTALVHAHSLGGIVPGSHAALLMTSLPPL